MKLDCAVITSNGAVRRSNEDNFSLDGIIKKKTTQNTMTIRRKLSCKKRVFAVCDGMGGEVNGELASLIAVQEVVGAKCTQIEKTARKTIADANARIVAQTKEQGIRGMGTTFAALYVDKHEAVAVNVGDSRVYRLHQGALQQLSHDHTLVQSMVKLGVITREQALTHRDRHKLTQHIGIDETEMIIEPAVSERFQLEVGDTYLLCSDGLTDMVSDEEIRSLMGVCKTSLETANLLMKAALKAGGNDNITVLIVRVRKSGLHLR